MQRVSNLGCRRRGHEAGFRIVDNDFAVEVINKGPLRGVLCNAGTRREKVVQDQFAQDLAMLVGPGVVAALLEMLNE